MASLVSASLLSANLLLITDVTRARAPRAQKTSNDTCSSRGRQDAKNATKYIRSSPD